MLSDRQTERHPQNCFLTDLRQDVESLRNSHIPKDYQIYDDGYYYKAFNTQRTWVDAQATCQSEGAHLPVIQNERMRNFIHSLKPLGSWLGLTDQAKNGTWLTWDGKEAPYLH